MVREERRTARVLLLIRKMAATFCMTIACFHFFFLPLRLKTSRRRLTRFMAEVYKKRIKIP